jgi:AraC-like DNA-binding protein
MSLSPLHSLARAVGVPKNYFHGRTRAETCVPNNILIFRRTTRADLQRATFELRPHHRFVVIFNLATAGVVRIDGVPIALQPEQGLMILPFQFHTFPETDQDDILWLILTFECDQPAALEEFRGKIFPTDRTTRNRLTVLLGQYRAANDETTNQVLALETACLLAGLRPLVRKAMIPRTTTDQRARQLLDDIDAHLRSSPSVAVSIEGLAERLHVSESRLRARFRAAFGTTLGVYLRNYRLHLVIELMQDTRRNLTEIASELGFADSATFTRFFRTQVGATPSVFRRRMVEMTPAASGTRALRRAGSGTQPKSRTHAK